MLPCSMLTLILVCVGIFTVITTLAITFIFVRWLLITAGVCDISDL